MFRMARYGDHLQGFVDHVRILDTEFCLSRRRFPAQQQHSRNKECLIQKGLLRALHVQPTWLEKRGDNKQHDELAGEKTITRAEGRMYESSEPETKPWRTRYGLRQDLVNLDDLPQVHDFSPEKRCNRQHVQGGHDDVDEHPYVTRII